MNQIAQTSHEVRASSLVRTAKGKNPYRKYMIQFLVTTFGLCWGVCLLYIFFEPAMTAIFGELTLTNPLVILGLNFPSVMGLAIYCMYGGVGGLKKYLLTLVPKRKDLIWFPIIIIAMVLFVISVRLISMLFGIPVPEITNTPMQSMMIFLRNFYEEIGMLGIMFGFFGFLLPYFQRSFHSKVKAGLLTGFLLGLFVAPGYVFSSFEAATSFPFYLVQMMALSVCVSYVLNDTRGNVLFFLLTFWIVATGSKVQLYNFVPSVQIIQISLFLILWVVLHIVFSKRDMQKLPQERLCFFPEFIEA